MKAFFLSPAADSQSHCGCDAYARALTNAQQQSSRREEANGFFVTEVIFINSITVFALLFAQQKNNTNQPLRCLLTTSSSRVKKNQSSWVRGAVLRMPLTF